VKREMSSDGTNGLTLRSKMVLLSAAAFTAILLVTVISLMLMNGVRVGSTAYKTISNSKDALENIALLQSDLYQVNFSIQSFMMEADPIVAGKTAENIKKLSADIDHKFEVGIRLAEAPARRDSINKANSIWKDYKKTLQSEVMPAARESDVLKASYLMTGIQAERFSKFSTTVATLVETIRRDVLTTEEAVSSSVSSKIILNVIVALIAIGVIAVFSYLVTRSITGPLNACVDFARTIADGRLDRRLEVTGGVETAALAVAMNTMAENLNSVVSRINSATGVLTSIDNNIEKAAHQVVSSAQSQVKSVVETSQAVDQIKTSIRDVSQGVDKLSSSAGETASSTLEMAASIEEVANSAEKLGIAVEEVSSSIIEMASSIKEIGVNIVNLLDASTTTASSIAEMDATIKQVEKNAMDASAISEAVRSDAESGKKSVEEAIAGMQAIRVSSQITAEVVENLSLRANDIGAILSVIDEVAEQTNLLALNAAIIAAQAGEHGKGFAVVADEIRELAERTSSSTREIAAVIKGVQEDTRRAVDAISQAENSITEGEKLSQRSGAALEKIVTGVKRASIQVSEIARATVEQAKGSHCIKEAMESVEEMVGHIANSAREHSQGTDLITMAVEQMKDLTTHVRVSTREQSRASGLIARSTEDVTSLVGDIRKACRSQEENSILISDSVSHIQASTDVNSHAAKVMDTSVASLSRQIELLEKEMTGFKI